MIEKINHPTTFSGSFSKTTTENVAATGRLDATDQDGLTGLEIYSIESIHQGTHGNATVDPKTGEWTYLPNSFFAGTDQFAITVTDDDGHRATQVIDITIEDVRYKPEKIRPLKSFWPGRQ